MAGEKILVCDDEPGMRLVLAGALEPAGYRVLPAEDGPRALDLIRTEEPHLMLLDMGLPGLDGLEVLSRAREARPRMPVLMLSGMADVESAAEAARRGASDYLYKPFRLEEVRAAVARALEAAFA